jgi:hypothetical protein
MVWFGLGWFELGDNYHVSKMGLTFDMMLFVTAQPVNWKGWLGLLGFCP